MSFLSTAMKISLHHLFIFLLLYVLFFVSYQALVASDISIEERHLLMDTRECRNQTPLSVELHGVIYILPGLLSLGGKQFFALWIYCGLEFMFLLQIDTSSIMFFLYSSSQSERQNWYFSIITVHLYHALTPEVRVLVFCQMFHWEVSWHILSTFVKKMYLFLF